MGRGDQEAPRACWGVSRGSPAAGAPGKHVGMVEWHSYSDPPKDMVMPGLEYTAARLPPTDRTARYGCRQAPSRDTHPDK